MNDDVGQIRSLINTHLPDDWDDSLSREKQILRVVDLFLTRFTDGATQERRGKAQAEAAEEFEVTVNTIQSKCGRETWEDTYPESNDYQRQHFDPALESIEAEWEGANSSSQPGTTEPSTANVGTFERPGRHLSPDSTRFITIRVSQGSMKIHFDETVFADVDTDTVSKHTGRSFDRETIRLWGNRQSTVANQEVSAGDWLLFYYGDEYIAAAEVSGTNKLAKQQAMSFCNDIWPTYDADDPFDYVVYLSEVYTTSIDLDRFWASRVLDYNGHPNDGWTNLDSHMESIAREYGSLEGFIETIADELLYDYWDIAQWPLETSFAKRLNRQLARKGQTILYGPPGTGKSFTADTFSEWLIGRETGRLDNAGRIETVTFHPSFSYEDFIEGYTVAEDEQPVDIGTSSPTLDDYKSETESDSSSSNPFRLKDGSLKRFCLDAQAAYESWQMAGSEGTPPSYVFVIDEINRGNLAKIFGELIKLVEKSKRGQSVTLAHSGKRFTIPPNVYVLGTMNTADQSIALVDAALRRRFAAIPVPPNYQLLYSQEAYPFESREEAIELAQTDRHDLPTLKAASVLALEVINYKIARDTGLDRGKRIGHSYLQSITSG